MGVVVVQMAERAVEVLGVVLREMNAVGVSQCLTGEIGTCAQASPPYCGLSSTIDTIIGEGSSVVKSV